MNPQPGRAETGANAAADRRLRRALPPAAADASGSAAGEPTTLAGKTVWVVDANSLIFQVFHAIPEMTSPRGEPVAAVYGFTRDLLFLLDEKKPDYLFVAFDRPEPTFRHELFPEYKGTAQRNAARSEAAVSRHPADARGDGHGGARTGRVRSRRHSGHDRPPHRRAGRANAFWSPATKIAGN